MNRTKNVYGSIESSLDWINTEFSAKKTNKDVRAGIKSEIDNMTYHLRKQSDIDFLAFMVPYQEAQLRELKNKQKFDKVLNRQTTGKMIVLKRIGAVLK